MAEKSAAKGLRSAKDRFLGASQFGSLAGLREVVREIPTGRISCAKDRDTARSNGRSKWVVMCPGVEDKNQRLAR